MLCGSLFVFCFVFVLTIAWSVLLRFTASDYLFQTFLEKTEGTIRNSQSRETSSISTRLGTKTSTTQNTTQNTTQKTKKMNNTTKKHRKFIKELLNMVLKYRWLWFQITILCVTFTIFEGNSDHFGRRLDILDTIQNGGPSYDR